MAASQTEGVEKAASQPAAQPERPGRALLIASALLPVLLLGGILYLFSRTGTGLNLGAPPAPIEKLEFERVEFVPGEIRAHVINTGPEALTISQVQVGWTTPASWQFTVFPSPTIPRLERATLAIPYPWVAGEPYEIKIISANTLVFSHEIEIAAETPTAGPALLGSLALLGVYVGVLPVFLGIGWLPFLRALPQRWYFFLLSLTSGLLVFLGVDALHEALENAGRVPGPYQGLAVILMGVSLSVLGLYGISGWLKRRSREHSEENRGLLLAYTIALSIGLHNLGEGLAIGGAYALGEIGMGTLLVIGFTVHNLTEGVAVVAPVVRSKFKWIHLLWMGLLAGAPTIAGTMFGAFAYDALWAVLFLAIGAGAIIQVVIEITRHQIRQAGAQSLAGGYSLAGFAAGLAVMYTTGLFVTM
ncbi:MAG: metal transporter [Acidobacteria bacterium]|nr:metal transporter [Acidobacteriota bacterium]